MDPDTLDLGAAFSNQSLGVVQAELLRRLKPRLSTPLDDAPERHRWLRGYFAHEVLLAQNGDRFTLRPEQAEVLAERGRAAIEAIRSAGYDVVGDLEELVPAPRTLTFVTPRTSRTPRSSSRRWSRSSGC